MRHLIPFRTAATWAFRIFLVLTVFHLIVVVGILAFDTSRWSCSGAGAWSGASC